ncbi:exodeoxyribonuclease VII large subunit [Leptospira sp. 2 VSF19]|uniref:Exodeoxyribonuclease 7 large subunit n=1 Tax=Leptospira soteropolitanensis TaxID=2950025 RepID=A0AAW5VB85_9LEPT|nr:exodeoxyribonuclease VII large subunit [Leptospira soteropolitanensis]MCW7492030.1 exodeoxyribonuclease VII large subunit [Leptospira soteropolitanensis]MCW7499612.1 exodeoxyribonuclease VII large subunit [Leptospira soteropolitanensis]MCW7521863.1 exodeoxyribonuclease VII large subunit [Leptospira soteropolitanensis]MCW7525717.1 exodeoxyribonuclease VII large subunit [Leptospira soteropolitanensis]MCW7530169.1 exodeoxyribonuclease VII large subunit [Leptospira soteropolitanensis]
MEQVDSSLSVSEVNRLIKTKLQDSSEFKNIWVRGEISNHSQTNSSGHIYFSLKDTTSVIKCAFFSFQAKNYKGTPLRNGMEILVYGSISVYEPGGYYSLTVQKIEEIGEGDILLKIEKLKKALLEKGIFDATHKRPLPKFPKRLGIVTSPKGAAVEDIIRIATDLNPSIQILISPCLVQGDGAEASIIEAIREINDPKWEVDVIIAGRGGGSFEDLMAFNQESVVMAYYNSRIPIISAVGHEIDRVLTDLAADATTPTPTAAAKLAIPNVSDTLIRLDEMEERLKSALTNVIRVGKEKWMGVSTRPVFQNPKTLLETRSTHLDELMTKISLLGKNYLVRKQSEFQRFDHLSQNWKSYLERIRNKFTLAEQRLDHFSPLGTLKRGYSVVRNQNKQVISSIHNVSKNESLEVFLSDGKLLVEVKDKI